MDAGKGILTGETFNSDTRTDAQTGAIWVARLKPVRIPCTLCETLQTFVGLIQIM